MTREPQYDACFKERPVTLGPMTGATWRWNPRRLGFMLARYKFVAQMLKGKQFVAEIGCADGFGSVTVAEEVGHLHLFDFDELWCGEACHLFSEVRCCDITVDPLMIPPGRRGFDAVYMLDVIEHIAPEKEPKAIGNIIRSLAPGGTFIAGAPSLESQAYASDISKAGHVNCRSGETLKADMERYFRNVFLFGMNDEVLHCGFPQMCHYLFVLCTEPRL
jgi:2-polyprenyl-3-methyl-5-hydroxy-6-metoxy-1,4-benzoquinol methylase